jgi:hypothetical protein
MTAGGVPRLDVKGRYQRPTSRRLVSTSVVTGACSLVTGCGLLGLGAAAALGI